MFFLKAFGLSVLFCLRQLRLFLVVVIGVLLLPVLIFCPPSVSENFGDKVDYFLLKFLRVAWRVIKTSLLILLALIIFLLGPILWPVYLGILVLFPRFAAYIMSIKIF